MQLKLTLALPLLVVRLREAFPCRAQTEINSFTEAVRNWEFILVDIFERVLEAKESSLDPEGFLTAECVDL